MARGKHSSEAVYRRWKDAEERATVAERALKRERADHGITRRVAERVAGMENRCKELEQEVALATCDEIERLTAMIDRQRVELEEGSAFRATIQRKWDVLITEITDLMPGPTVLDRMAAVGDLLNPGELQGRTVLDPTIYAATHLKPEALAALNRSKRRRFAQQTQTPGMVVKG